jgi:hypothetical protein
MGRVEYHQSLDALGVLHGQQPGQRAAQSCPAMVAEPASKATIRSATFWASSRGR